MGATPQWEANNRLSNFDPASNRLVPAQSGFIANRAQVNPDRNNFAPRLGAAYSLNSKTVLRGAYGMSYVHFNRAGGGNILGINGPQVVIAAVVQNPAQAGFRTTAQGYPAGLTDPDRFNPLAANISYIPRDTRTGYVQNWSFSIQRELPGGFLLDLGYVASQSENLIIFADFNEARPLTAAQLALPAAQRPTLQQRRPNQSFSAITVTWPEATANYHALQFRMERKGPERVLAAEHLRVVQGD